MTTFIETVADQLPEPWASRVEVALRELGGIIWIQIASAIVLLRLVLWVPFHFWRLWREREIKTSSFAAEYFRYLADRGEHVSVDLEAQLARTIEDTGREMRHAISQ